MKMSLADQLFIGALAVCGLLGAPVALIWGWVRLLKSGDQGVCSRFSQLAFVVATTSALLAIGSVLYAHRIGGFPFYDPLLLKIYRTGVLLSGGAFLISIAGVWRKSSLRWHAPAASFGMLAFWLGVASSE